MILDSIVLYIQCTGYMLKRTAMERSLRRLLPPRLKEMLAYLLEIYFENSYIRKIRGPRRRYDPITIDMFDEMECWERFRVRKEDIPRVLRALKLDADDLFVTDNNIKFTGLEVSLHLVENDARFDFVLDTRALDPYLNLCDGCSISILASSAEWLSCSTCTLSKISTFSFSIIYSTGSRFSVRLLRLSDLSYLTNAVSITLLADFV